ncbi:MAG: hypothetical protein JXA69_20865 [Phycisphaerae bacterium]|nr:hypothetical protein [Phycisphaerae bacterium]
MGLAQSTRRSALLLVLVMAVVGLWFASAGSDAAQAPAPEASARFALASTGARTFLLNTTSGETWELRGGGPTGGDAWRKIPTADQAEITGPGRP